MSARNDPRKEHTLQAVAARALDALGRPGFEAWSVALALTLTGWLLPVTDRGRLFLAPVGASALLSLATARAWRSQRRLAEFVVLSAALLLTAIALTRLPEVLQLGLSAVFMVIVSLGVFAWMEWRFAPDFGQRGRFWAIAGGMLSATWSGAGLTLAMIACAVLEQRAGTSAALLYAVGAILGRAVGSLFASAASRAWAPAIVARCPEIGEATEDGWKQGGGS